MDLSELKIDQKYIWKYPDAAGRKDIREVVTFIERTPRSRVHTIASSVREPSGPRTPVGFRLVRIRTESGEEREVTIAELFPLNAE